MTSTNPLYLLQSFSKQAQKEANSKLSRKTTISTLQSSLRRHESLIETVSQATNKQVACTEGCSYCCSYCRVFVTPPEVFLLKQSIQKSLSTTQLTDFIHKLTDKVRHLTTLSNEDFYNSNIDCIFLENNLCSVYEVRPFNCRNYHATDVEGCITTYNNAEADVANAFVEELFIAGQGFTEGVINSYQAKGYDVTSYELHSALLEAFINTKSELRWAKKKRAFLTAITQSSRVPTESLTLAV